MIVAIMAAGPGSSKGSKPSKPSGGTGCLLLIERLAGPCWRRMGHREWAVVAVLAIVALILLAQQMMGGYWQQAVQLMNMKSPYSPFEISAETQIYEMDSGGYISIKPRYRLAFPAKVKLLFSEAGLVTTIDTFLIPAYSLREIFIPLHTEESVGHVTMTFKTDSTELPQLYKAHVHVKIVHYVWLAYFSLSLGWCYFLAWSVSYYPQFYKNWKRRSVVGLSLDYILLNIIGHSSYCAFNASLYYNSYIQKSYLAMNPNSEIPVQANDLFFSMHAVLMTTLIIGQAVFYDRGDQQLSTLFICIASGMMFTVVGGLVLAWHGHMSWLRYVYVLSFIKVVVTPLKYIPQVILNHRRRSTEGFAIIGVVLDFCGSILSLGQASLDSWNSDDWTIAFGNPGKLALAFIGISFNLVFFSQYAVFSRVNKRSRKDSSRQDGDYTYRKLPMIRDV